MSRDTRAARKLLQACFDADAAIAAIELSSGEAAAEAALRERLARQIKKAHRGGAAVGRDFRFVDYEDGREPQPVLPMIVRAALRWLGKVESVLSLAASLLDEPVVRSCFH